LTDDYSKENSRLNINLNNYNFTIKEEDKFDMYFSVIEIIKRTLNKEPPPMLFHTSIINEFISEVVQKTYLYLLENDPNFKKMDMEFFEQFLDLHTATYIINNTESVFQLYMKYLDDFITK